MSQSWLSDRWMIYIYLQNWVIYGVNVGKYSRLAMCRTLTKHWFASYSFLTRSCAALCRASSQMHCRRTWLVATVLNSCLHCRCVSPAIFNLQGKSTDFYCLIFSDIQSPRSYRVWLKRLCALQNDSPEPIKLKFHLIVFEKLCSIAHENFTIVYYSILSL